MIYQLDIPDEKWQFVVKASEADRERRTPQQIIDEVVLRFVDSTRGEVAAAVTTRIMNSIASMTPEEKIALDDTMETARAARTP